MKTQKLSKAAQNADKKARALYASNAWQWQIDQARARYTNPEAIAAFDAAIFDEQKTRYGMQPGGGFTSVPLHSECHSPANPCSPSCTGFVAPAKPTYKLPTVSELKALFVALKKHIGDDYRASDDLDDNTPAMSITIGANERGEWNYQTGDNSYTGGAYGFPHWAVVTLERRSNSKELAKEVQDQLSDSMAQ